MDYLLSHIQHWLTFRGPPMLLGECLLLLMILLAAGIAFNIVTNTSDPARMIGNFLSLLAGAGLGGALFPETLPSVDPTSVSSLPCFQA